MAHDRWRDVTYFGTMMVHRAWPTAWSRARRTPPRTPSGPAFEIIKTAPGRLGRLQRVLHVPGRPGAGLRRLRGQPRPDAEQLADIAISSAGTAAAFGIEPRVAMLSYSTGESGAGADVDKVRAATDAGPRARGRTCWSRARSSTTRRSTRRSRATKLPGIRGRRPGDRVHLPGPQHRQQHLQGRAALGRRGRGRAGAAGAAQAGQRPLARARRCPTSSTRWRSRRSRRRAGRRVVIAGPRAQRRLLVDQVPAASTWPGRSRARPRRADRRARGRLATAPRRRAAREELIGPRAAAGARRFDDRAGARRRRPPGGARRQRFTAPTVVDDEVLAEIATLVPLAPLHNPANLAGIEVARALLPGRSAGRGVRHGVPPDHAAARPVSTRSPRDARRRHAGPPLRLPRHVARVRRPGRPPSCSGATLAELELDRRCTWATARQRSAVARRAQSSTPRWA